MAKSRRENKWHMDRNISEVVGFSIGIDNHYSLKIDRFPSTVLINQSGERMVYEPVRVGGIKKLYGDEGFMRVIKVPSDGKVISDSRLWLSYSDEGSCGPEYQVGANFLDGEIVCVSGDTSCVGNAIEKAENEYLLRESILEETFKGAVKDRLSRPKKTFQFRTLQSLIRNSNLPAHYKEAVEEVL